MPRVSINILTKDRALALRRALLSVVAQNFKNYEVIVVDDGSKDETQNVIQTFKYLNILIITHQSSLGISKSRQEALMASQGEYIAILDDDDEWTDPQKLEKQAKFLNEHQEVVLVGGAIRIQNSELRIKNNSPQPGSQKIFDFLGGKPPLNLRGGAKFRPQDDQQIRRTMLFRNNFFTSTVMFRREVAIKAGGFIKDQDDFAEDYDLWLRMGKLGKMHNFQEIFTLYHQSDYNKERFKAFLQKQRILIKQHRQDYPYHGWAEMILKFRLLFNFLDFKL